MEEEGGGAWIGKTGTFNESNIEVKWGNGFRGGGWTSAGTFDYEGWPNSTISLTVTTQ
ncbi:MAG: hypothetical protein LBT00_07295 [Spirochaetaceae bacterium]|nr:hypothetical protein [Spirochaetaceae bacterium]